MRTTRQCLHSKDKNTICDNNRDLFRQQKPNDFFKMSFLLFFLSNSLSRGNTKGCLTKHIALNNYALKKMNMHLMATSKERSVEQSIQNTTQRNA